AIRIVADATGEAEAGTAMIAAFDARLARIAAEAATEAGPRPSALVYQVGGSISLEGTLADAALTAAGFRNAGRSLAHARGAQVPLEALVAHPPDLLVLASPPLAYRTVVADNLRHPALRALTQRVESVELPWRLWLCGTKHVGDAIEDLAAARRRLARGATQ
ncbi:MAG: ABC transporter substrate-binding protein, partial [Hyphomicrobiales bacterium]